MRTSPSSAPGSKLKSRPRSDVWPQRYSKRSPAERSWSGDPQQGLVPGTGNGVGIALDVEVVEGRLHDLALAPPALCAERGAARVRRNLVARADLPHALGAHAVGPEGVAEPQRILEAERTAPGAGSDAGRLVVVAAHFHREGKLLVDVHDETGNAALLGRLEPRVEAADAAVPLEHAQRLLDLLDAQRRADRVAQSRFQDRRAKAARAHDLHVSEATFDDLDREHAVRTC